MQISQYCPLVKEYCNAIGSAEIGYVAEAISVSVNTLDKIAGNESLPMEVRKDAAYAAANLLISDYSD